MGQQQTEQLMDFTLWVEINSIKISVVLYLVINTYMKPSQFLIQCISNEIIAKVRIYIKPMEVVAKITLNQGTATLRVTFTFDFNW